MISYLCLFVSMWSQTRGKISRISGVLKPKYAVMAIKRPTHLVQYLKSLRIETELEQAPARMASLCSKTESKIEGYFEEIDSDDEFIDAFHSRWDELNETGRGSTPLSEARVLYAFCRAVEPETVVVSGAGYGGFDAHILNALEKKRTR